MISPAFQYRDRYAFSLPEMLCVMGIIAVVAVLSAGAFQHISRSSHLTSSGQALVAQLEMARQAALTLNRPVELRMYELLERPGSAERVYRGLQAFSIEKTGAKALGDPLYLKEPLVISTASQTSSLMDLPELTSGADFPTLPGVGTSYKYRSFHFKTDGGTDLAASRNWFLTIYKPTDPTTGPEGLPTNFVTIQIDPRTGGVRQFRP